MNYIILNGVNSNTITGLLIQELPPISKPLMRTQIDQIDGRDGDIVTKLGYSTVDKELSIGLHGNFNIDSVIEYFASEGTVIFSNEPDKYYRYQVLDQIDFERLVRFRTATVTMHCQPFKYEVNEDPIEEAGSTDTTGDIVSFEAQSADAVGVKVNVEPYQNLNGYDSPWVGGAGANKFDKTALQTNSTVSVTQSASNSFVLEALTTGTYRSVSYWIDGDFANKTYYLKGSIVASGTNNAYLSVRPYDSNNNEIGGNRLEWNINSTTSRQRTFPAGTVKLNVVAYVTASVSATVGDKATFTNIMLSESDVAWTPYENICPIYPANGKNLFDESLFDTDTSTIVYTSYSVPNGTYIMSSEDFPFDANTANVFFLAGSVSTGANTTNNGVYKNRPITITVTDGHYTVAYRSTGVNTNNPKNFRFQIEHGNIATEYVPYNAIGITRTGKNLLNVNNPNRVFRGGTMVFEGSTLKLSGTASSTNSQAWPADGFLLRAGTYTFSHDYRGTAVFVIGNWKTSYTVATGTTKTFTLSEDSYVTWGVIVTSGTTYNDLVHAQIEVGSSATQYEPYTAERYYSISDNPVYGGTLEVETGVLTVDTGYYELPSTLDWAISSVRVGRYYIKNATLNIGAKPFGRLICNQAKGVQVSTTVLGECYLDTNGQYAVNTSYSTVADFKQSIVGNPITIAYELATPLVYQLTPVQVKTLLGYNNIWTDSGTVTVSVPNMISVVNEGNTTAKPTMTIYGSGDIGVWLNGMQVFQIALGDTGNITIDAEQMEAYQGGILRNRLVTGDYSNFVLQKGENTISVTGNVTNVEITNYSRWL